MRLALVTIACLAASASAARPLSPFGLPRGGSAVSDYAGLCEAVKGNIVEKAGQSVSNLFMRGLLTLVYLSVFTCDVPNTYILTIFALKPR